MIIEIERENDGRWIAEIDDLSGGMAYGGAGEEAIARIKALALRVIAERLEYGETIPELNDLCAVAAGVNGVRAGSCRITSDRLAYQTRR
jgi:predicted RNase H-like HicB family nuclease